MARADRNEGQHVSHFVRALPKVNGSPLGFLRWALTNPFHSWRGGRALRRSVEDAVPVTWQVDFTQRRVLVVGSGPSLDRVDASFFERFETAIYINFALLRSGAGPKPYFLSTDIGVIRKMIERYGVVPFKELGSDRSLLAPIFLDQWRLLMAPGRRLFTVLCFDEAKWRVQWVKLLGGLRLPLILRYHPRQAEWETFQLPAGGRRLPIVDHTSALTAVLFAAMHGARSIGLIGCDFSKERASSIGGDQAAPPTGAFVGAAAEFSSMVASLASQGVAVTNHSWGV